MGWTSRISAAIARKTDAQRRFATGALWGSTVDDGLDWGSHNSLSVFLVLALFRKDPASKLRKAWKAKLTEAMHAHRNGDIRSYAFLTAEAEQLKSELDALTASDKPD